MIAIQCTKERPWKRGNLDGGECVAHRDAMELASPSGKIVGYKCPHCGTYWRADHEDEPGDD